MTPAHYLSPTRLKSALEAASTPAFKLSFSILLILAALGATYLDSEGNFPGIELRDVLIRGLVVSSILLFSALALSLRSRTASNVTLALVTLLGIFTAYLVHTDLFYPQNRAWLAMACIAALFALFVANRLMDDFRWGGLTLTMVASIPLFLLIWSQTWPMLIPGLGTPGGLIYWGNPSMWVGVIGVCAGLALMLYMMSRIVAAPSWDGLVLLAITAFLMISFLWLDRSYGEDGSGFYEHGWESHPNVQSVTFKETPNLYLIGFESISPETLMRKHMGIETTDFHRLMDERMRRFQNLFANAATTRNSFQTLMALDLDIFLEHQEDARSLPSYFGGHDLSPLVWVLKENGYETSSLYQNAMFGHTQGPGIDNYKVNILAGSVACSLLDQKVRRLAFWGHCWNKAETHPELPFGDYLIREIRRLDRNYPQFVIAHHHLPGHASNLFDSGRSDMGHGEFLERYERGFNSAATYLEEAIEHIKDNDPDAILFVFGDHGPLLSRGIEIEDNPTFFLQDWFGILGGVYPPNRCVSEFDEAESKGYVTSLDIVHAILECLSGGHSPLREPRNDRFWGPGVPEDHSYRYENYLYE